jgi:tripartite-type tricarboxylate transporter receptor subunit TctC
MNTTSRWLGLIALNIFAVLSFSAFAQSYPVKPVRIVVGFQPGGGVDISARSIGQKLSEAIGQSVVVDNRPGASGNIAADHVAKATPDGYTLLMANATISMPSLFARLPFDVNKDLMPISLVALGPSVLVVHPSLPVKGVKELIALAKARPKDVLYGSGGRGNITHLEMELFSLMAGIDMIHVPYKGGAPSVIGLLTGEVHALFTSIPSVMAHINSKRVKPIAVSTLRRSGALPNVPTVDESGLAGYDAASWYGLFAPAGIPKNAINVLTKELVRIMGVQEIRAKFSTDGFEPVGNSPEEFSKFIRAEISKWAKIIEMADMKPQ